jgi:hypothetical protein
MEQLLDEMITCFNGGEFAPWLRDLAAEIGEASVRVALNQMLTFVVGYAYNGRPGRFGGSSKGIVRLVAADPRLLDSFVLTKRGDLYLEFSNHVAEGERRRFAAHIRARWKPHINADPPKTPRSPPGT